MAILIGTSGFSYDDWRGHFYPPDLKKGEMLPFYARRFPAVEVNSTYYRLPSAATMFQMARKVPEGFRFAVKASGEMTHSEEHQPAAYAQFREAMEPLREAGMLGCVLAQFPWSFRRTPEHLDYLRALRDELEGIPTVVEFRNAEWITEDLFDRLRGLGLGYCCVDEPRLKGLVPPVVTATAPTSYVRFHGRNAARWWKHEHSWERYNYLYSAEELAEWAPKIQELAAQTEQTYVFFNNHYEGKAGHNARQLAGLLNLTLPDLEVGEGSGAALAVTAGRQAGLPGI